VCFLYWRWSGASAARHERHKPGRLKIAVKLYLYHTGGVHFMRVYASRGQAGLRVPIFAAYPQCTP